MATGCMTSSAEKVACSIQTEASMLAGGKTMCERVMASWSAQTRLSMRANGSITSSMAKVKKNGMMVDLKASIATGTVTDRESLSCSMNQVTKANFLTIKWKVVASTLGRTVVATLACLWITRCMAKAFLSMATDVSMKAHL